MGRDNSNGNVNCPVGVADENIAAMTRLKVAYRWTRKTATRWLRAIKVESSPLFRGGAAFWGIGLFMGLYCWVFSLNQYKAAEGIAVFVGLWCALCWVNSEYLGKKWRAIHGPKRKPENVPHFVFRYRFVKWLGVLFMLAITAGFVRLAFNSKLAFEQDDVFNRLETEVHMPPGTKDEPTLTEFTVRNGGHFDISGRQQLSCKVNTEILDNRAIIRDYSIYGYKPIPGGAFLLSRDPALPEYDTKIRLTRKWRRDFTRLFVLG